MLLLEAELGGPWTDFYSELTPKPIAAASLGQVCTRMLAATNAISGAGAIYMQTVLRTAVTVHPSPLHAALQVYKGKLKDGTPVAVKVQRPHVVETVSVDLFIIRYCCALSCFTMWACNIS